ncbi:hypothetical protein GW755_02290 [bacterium]|nr:hypothetical protein [bacterium]
MFIYNPCAAFTYQEDAQEVLEKCSGAGFGIIRLDGDDDCLACKSLPSKK